MRRLLSVGLSVLLILAVSGLLSTSTGFNGTTNDVVLAQDDEVALGGMEQRIGQVMEALNPGQPCNVVRNALDLAPEVLYGGLRVLPSKGDERTFQVDQLIRRHEMMLAEHLRMYALEGGCEEEQGRALDLKIFIEEISEVAAAVGQITRQCGENDSLAQGVCGELVAFLDEERGEIGPARIAGGQFGGLLRPSYSVKLRSPFIPQWTRNIQELVKVTEPIGYGECVSVFKESRGLMLKLHFERIIIVRDPWVSVFGAPRGTKIPVWQLEWVPAEYVKSWNLCNQGGQIVKTVDTMVKQEEALNYFWRYYPVH